MDLKDFYPTSTLVTGFDILFFWVARMIMMGLKFMGDVPFRDVYIHALVRDEQGQKMSKSKGNVIDPLDIMSQYGTDAFRFTLAAMAAMGRDIKLAEDRIAGYQNFVNKLWNAARFVQMNLGDADDANGNSQRRYSTIAILASPSAGFARVWLRPFAKRATRSTAIVSTITPTFLYQFTWHEFCDWYIEMSKLALNSADANVAARSRQLLRELLEQILLLLHPIMPFVTEEIWQVLGDRCDEHHGPTAIPRSSRLGSMPRLEKQMNFLMDVIRAVRNLRTELNCPPGKEVKVIFCGADSDLAFLREQQPYLRRSGAGRSVRIIAQPAIGPKERPPPWSAPRKFICRLMIWSISTRSGHV